MEENNTLQEDQVIEVEYDKDLVEDYKQNYIMEEEGTGADPEAEPYDPQTTLNETPLDDMLDNGEAEIEEVIEDDKKD